MDATTALLLAGASQADLQAFKHLVWQIRHDVQALEAFDLWVDMAVQRLGMVAKPRLHAALLRGAKAAAEQAAHKRAYDAGGWVPLPPKRDKWAHAGVRHV